METVSISIFTFAELSEKAKQKALENYVYNDEYHWSHECLQSLKKGLDFFDCTLKSYSIDWLGYYDISIKEWDCKKTENLSGNRLRTFILNSYGHALMQPKVYKSKSGLKRKSKVMFEETSCPFTGVCFDEDFLNVIRKFVAKPDDRTFIELIEDAANAVIKSGQKDAEYQFSEEGYSDFCEANEIMFTEDGRIFG